MLLDRVNCHVACPERVNHKLFVIAIKFGGGDRMPLGAHSFPVTHKQNHWHRVAPAIRTVSGAIQQLHDSQILTLAVIKSSKVPADHKGYVRLAEHGSPAEDNFPPEIHRNKGHSNERRPPLLVYAINRLDTLSMARSQTRQPPGVQLSLLICVLRHREYHR